MMHPMPVMTLRALNRTLLERQSLASRSSRSALETVEHLTAMQAQEPNWPYVGLWTRLKDFRKEELDALQHDRSVVRSIMLRRTQHLARAEDFRWLRPTVQPIIDAALSTSYYASKIEGMDLEELAATGRELLAGRTLTRRQLGVLLAERFPGRHGGRLTNTLEILEAMVHPPPNGCWGGWGNRTETPVARAEEWLGRPMAPAAQPDTLILRYLAAFGPATVMDVQNWAGITRLRPVMDALRPQLRVFRNEQGKELFDLPDAPVADPDLPVPVRFLPAFDNAALGHKDRTRIISEEDRRRVAPEASLGVPFFLVDGFVHGTWSTDGKGLAITPFRPLTPAARAEVLEEAERLLDFIAPEASGRDITLA